jgi:hypothetical protein
MHNQSRGRLIEVTGLNSDMITNAEREYDTAYLDSNGQKKYYELPRNCAMIRLVFIGSLGIPFSTLRRLKDSAWTLYARKLKEEFDFIIEQEVPTRSIPLEQVSGD